MFFQPIAYTPKQKNSCLLLATMIIWGIGCTHQSEKVPPKIESIGTTNKNKHTQSWQKTNQNNRNLAYLQLMLVAEKQFRQRNYTKAIAVAERVLRIERTNPEVYLLLAKSHLATGFKALAIQFAQQGLSFSPKGDSKNELLKIQQLQ